MLAAGTDLQYDDASIVYWDPRSLSEPVHVHSSTHSDDITVLHFHPSSPRLLLSASSDGLLSTSDAREADEDEAVREVANWGCSIARAGWFTCDADYNIWAASDMETYGLWNGELDLLVDCGDVRQASLPGQWTTDYIVDAWDFPGAPGPCGTSGLTLFLGSNLGDVACASISDSLDAQLIWTARGIFRGVHSDAVVRSVLWDETKGVLLTGDESGRLAAWRPAMETVEEDIEMADVESSYVGVGSKRTRDDDSDQNAKRGRYAS
ncbi:hypothetical protein JB92DRAFT_2916946 [Gautieria morchelliformis]|nr:hypothetical protein JB92DRAFT_2916946 [Gautieria morchelliformis]